MPTRPRTRYVTGGLTITILGAFFFTSYIVYLVSHESYLQGPLWLLPFGVLMVGVLSFSLIYGGYWVATREFTSEQGWEVVIWLFAGVIATLAVTFWPIFYQRIVGVEIEDPVFILLVSGGLGANAGVVAGISKVQTKRQFQHVQQARDSLEFLNRLLRHNILNAINIIQGNADQIVEKATSDSTVKRARTIHNHSAQIDNLIQNVRILVQRGEYDNELEQVDLTAVVADELAVARQSHDEVIIETDLTSAVTVWADPLVSAVIENLVTNAIVHNDQETPRVDVTLETKNDSAVLQIADNGPGLPDKTEEALIDPGEHGDSGIGLYLVDRLVSQYGGDVRFGENDPRGTVVTLELPLA